MSNLLQLSIDLTIDHNQHGENASYQEKRPKFNGQAQKVLQALLSGETVSSSQMYDRHRIIDTRARIHALEKKLEIEIPWNYISGGNGSKSWFLTAVQKEQIKNMLK